MDAAKHEALGPPRDRPGRRLVPWRRSWKSTATFPRGLDSMASRIRGVARRGRCESAGFEPASEGCWLTIMRRGAASEQVILSPGWTTGLTSGGSHDSLPHTGGYAHATAFGAPNLLDLTLQATSSGRLCMRVPIENLDAWIVSQLRH